MSDFRNLDEGRRRDGRRS